MGVDQTRVGASAKRDSVVTRVVAAALFAAGILVGGLLGAWWFTESPSTLAELESRLVNAEADARGRQAELDGAASRIAALEVQLENARLQLTAANARQRAGGQLEAENWSDAVAKLAALAAADPAARAGEAGKGAETAPPTPAEEILELWERGLRASALKAIEALHELEDPAQAAELAMQMIESASGSRKVSAMEALAELDPEAAAEYLPALLDDGGVMVRRRAARLLADLGDRSAIPLLREAFEQTEGNFAGERAHLVQVLENLGDHDYLDEQLEAARSGVASSDPALQIESIEKAGVLGQVGPCVQALGAASWEVRGAAVQCVRRVGTRDDIEALNQLAQDPDPTVAANASAARALLEAREGN